MDKLEQLAQELGTGIDKGEDQTSQTSSKSKDAEVSSGLGGFSTKLHDASVSGFKCDPYPQQGGFRPYWSALCFKVSAAAIPRRHLPA